MPSTGWLEVSCFLYGWLAFGPQPWCPVVGVPLLAQGFIGNGEEKKTEISILRTLTKLTTECSFYRRGSITEKDLDLLVFSKPLC